MGKKGPARSPCSNLIDYQTQLWDTPKKKGIHKGNNRIAREEFSRNRPHTMNPTPEKKKPEPKLQTLPVYPNPTK